MNLFIDTISKLATIILFNNEREIIGSLSWDIKGNESSTLIPQIDKLLKNNNVIYSGLNNIVVVNGPGSFTGIRTTVLAANSINYIIKKNMTAISYFDLHSAYPIIKSSSKRDCFFKQDKNSNIEIISNENLLNLLNNSGIKKVYGEAETKLFPDIEIFEKIDYVSIIKQIELTNVKQISALYIKKPNIS
ncbi:MAG: tRNA (adenosine(37)-N6)-threonylcarbamoyltransferase complex dimerization subunit type 1 TsaB [Candidatus Gracilibacteria bacterium]